MNVILPLLWKSFAFVYTADLVATVGLYYFKFWSLPQSERDAIAQAAAAAKAAREAAEAQAMAEQQGPQ